MARTHDAAQEAYYRLFAKGREVHGNHGGAKGLGSGNSGASAHPHPKGFRGLVTRTPEERVV